MNSLIIHEYHFCGPEGMIAIYAYTERQAWSVLPDYVSSTLGYRLIWTI